MIFSEIFDIIYIENEKKDRKLLRFIGHYGCLQETNEIALEATSLESANSYLHECACESYNNYIYNKYINEEDKYKINKAHKENIEYWVEPFNYLNPEHCAILKAQENEFWRV